ncbi:hypothetical protein NL676_024025 [Syzygium grande]|nr:hypothetical protein NL676_024025 [Syzygium grande]
MASPVRELRALCGHRVRGVPVGPRAGASAAEDRELSARRLRLLQGCRGGPFPQQVHGGRRADEGGGQRRQVQQGVQVQGLFLQPRDFTVLDRLRAQDTDQGR